MHQAINIHICPVTVCVSFNLEKIELLLCLILNRPNPIKASCEKCLKCSSAMAYHALLEDLANHAVHRDSVFKARADLLCSLFRVKENCISHFSHAVSFLLFVMPLALSEPKIYNLDKFNLVYECFHFSVGEVNFSSISAIIAVRKKEEQEEHIHMVDKEMRCDLIIVEPLLWGQMAREAAPAGGPGLSFPW